MNEFLEIIKMFITQPPVLIALTFGITLTVANLIEARLSRTYDKNHLSDDTDFKCVSSLEIEIEKLENQTFNVCILSNNTELESQCLSETDFDTLKKCITSAVDKL